MLFPAMDIRIQSWDDIPRKLLIQCLNETRKEEGLLEEPMPLERFNNYIQWVSERQDSVPIIAYDQEEVLGWLAFLSFVPKIGTIGRWHPIVKLGSQRDQIAAKLLKTCIAHAKTRGFNRLEAELTEITPKNEAQAQYYQRWFEVQGLCLSSEEARLERVITADSLSPVHLPSEYELVAFQEISNEELREPFFEIFDSSVDRFWLDQTPEQRLGTYNFWFNRERPVIEQATRILVKEGKIVGITVVRPIQDVGMIGPIGVRPQYRRQGLGRGLLAFSMHGALASGFQKVQLEFDITNEPAYALYRSMGFRHVHGLRLFALAL